MNISDIMTRNPVPIRSTSSVWEALTTMEHVGCHHLPVLSPTNHLIGIISARDCRLALHLPDVVREYWENDELAHQLSISMVMSVAPTVISPESSVAEAARLMLYQSVSCLPVMREETLVGIVTTTDILLAFSKT